MRLFPSRLALSRFIPVRFRSTYGLEELQARKLAADCAVAEGRTAFCIHGEQAIDISTGGAVQRVRSVWWQFRGHVMRHRITLA